MHGYDIIRLHKGREREKKKFDRIVPKSYVRVAISSCRAYNEALYRAMERITNYIRPSENKRIV